MNVVKKKTVKLIQGNIKNVATIEHETNVSVICFNKK